jgi:hypothetical protein
VIDDASATATVADAAGSLARLGALELDGLSDDDLTAQVLRMQELRGALEAAEARVLGEWDRRKVWRAEGAKAGAAWLASRQRLPMSEARRRLRHARAVRRFPNVAQAWASGAIDRTHVTTLMGACTARTEAAFEDGHLLLLDSARTRGFADFKRHCDIWTLYCDPDGAEQGTADGEAGRELHLSQSFGGMWFGRITLDPVNGAIVEETLRLIDRELFDADWASATARLGRDPLVTELSHTPAQRRADALVEMATRARTAPEGGRRPVPLFTVVVGLETLCGPLLELFNRTVITPGIAARWLTRADVERIVFESPSRVVDVGARRRFFRGALRRAIEIRDRTCFHSTCDEPPDRVEIDHIVDAHLGGPTTQGNGRLGCGFHNRWRTTHPDQGPDPPGG